MATNLSKLYAQDYEHPLDKSSLENLLRTPGIDRLVRKFTELGMERLLRTINEASDIEVTVDSFPDVYADLVEVCERINLPFIPKLHIERSDKLDAATIGAEDPVIIIASEAVERFTREELKFILGREVGHIKSDHVLYHQIDHFMPYISKAIGLVTLGIGNLFTPVVEVALHQWAMMADLTADRAGLLAVQNVETAVRALAKKAGLPQTLAHTYNPGHFIKQSRQIQSIEEKFSDKLFKIASALIADSSWAVSRTGELLKWVDSGNYDRVIHKSVPSSIRTEFCMSCNHVMRGTINMCTRCGGDTRVEMI